MNQIEVACSEQATLKIENNKSVKIHPRPGIDWAWWRAHKKTKLGKTISPIEYMKPKTIWDAFLSRSTWLPYIFPFLFGILFWLVYPRINTGTITQANHATGADGV